MTTMKRFLALLSIVGLGWLLTLTSAPGARAGQAFYQAEANVPQFSPEQLREDFQIAREALEEGHSGIYRYTTKAKMDEVFERAAHSLDRPMNAYEFYSVLAPVIAAIKDGHTGIRLPQSLEDEINNRAPLLPLDVILIDRKFYVVRDFAHEDGRLAGMEIRSINGVPISRIRDTMLAATPADGDVQSSRARLIASWRFNRLLLPLVGAGSPFDLVLWDAKRKRTRRERVDGLELPGLQSASKAKYPQDQPPPSPTALKFLDLGQIAQMKVRSFDGFADEQKKIKLSDFFRDSFTEIQKRGTKALILDLRSNGGGRDDIGLELFTYLTSKPFKYYEDLVANKDSFAFLKYSNMKELPGRQMLAKEDDGRYHATGHPNWGVHQPNQLNFTGRLYVLINGGCFSGCAEFASIAHYHRRAVFIGKESGGGYYGNTSGISPAVTLPNTKLMVFVPLLSYYMAVSGYKARTRGVIPNYPVTYTITERMAGGDKEMSLALKLAHDE